MPGLVLWEGPSYIDGAPLVLVATWGSSNPKTGDMIQTWILRADVSPQEAVASGDDRSICGHCPHRGDPELGRPRSCYVSVYQAPTSVWKKYRGIAVRRGVKANSYPRGTAADLPQLPIRLGAYGDPGLIPLELLAELTRGRAHTGYTHQWRFIPSDYASYLMASVESSADADYARSLGYRCFLVGSTPPSSGAWLLCPASEEAGKVTTCARCRLCSGTASKSRLSIYIPPHGAGSRAAERISV